MKTYRKIVLAGGNGYLGRVLADYYLDKAAEVVVLSRRRFNVSGNLRCVVWDAKTPGAWMEELSGADMLINLCGRNVNCRYNARNRREIVASRTIPTALLGKAVARLQQPPRLWINVTSATIYRHAEDRAQTETAGEAGYGFSVDVCKQWEATFFNCITPGVRKVALRLGIVLGRRDGVFPRLLNLVRLGLGGRQGDGSQYVSWIHEQDAAQITEWLLNGPAVDGVVNATAPEPVRNKVLMQTLRQTYGVPFGLPAPAWLLAIGARIIGTETELILKSRWVLPLRLQELGYRFQYPGIRAAIHDILSTRS
ncbi:TIGR01777 family protein [Pedobacter yulinensis]|uniref:TIGR01777 family protein n=1 Tax=Pedobacter yulinensis TaxID=2126353 RepID=A0A2T3HPN9_9SPHI|nr:TIGR01777 family oxidoreductase [Pedobacter yulinensis]PST84351.1 TIGR01777 family protein [Pedobacter yulinensis]